MEAVENNQAELEELKVYATEIGLKYNPNIGLDTLQAKVDAYEQELADKAKAKKEAIKTSLGKKKKCIVNPRQPQEGITDQFFGYGSMTTGKREAVLVKFDEEVELTEDMISHIKSIKFGEKKIKKVLDKDGIPQNEWYTKEKSRFLVELVD